MESILESTREHLEGMARFHDHGTFLDLAFGSNTESFWKAWRGSMFMEFQSRLRSLHKGYFGGHGEVP